MTKALKNQIIGTTILFAAVVVGGALFDRATTPSPEAKAYQPAPEVVAAPFPEVAAPTTDTSEVERVKAQASDRMAQSLIERCERDWLPSTCVQLRAELAAAGQ